MSTQSFSDSRYKRLLGNALPRAVQDEAEYDRLTEILHQLGEKEAKRDLSQEEECLVDLLLTLTEAYEEKNQKELLYGSPLEYLKAAMEHRELRQRDICHLFGSRGITSEVLNGKRAISKAQAFALAEFFRVDVGCFLEDPRKQG